MFNNIKRVAAVIALTGWMGVANASLIFDFSYGTTGNELVGEITGLVDGIDGQSQSAASISFTTTTGIYEAFQNISFLTPIEISYAEDNTFRLFSRQIAFIEFEFEAFVADYGGKESIFWSLRFETDGYIKASSNRFASANARKSDFNGFVNRVAPTPAPEPSALFLLALGLAGVSFSRYKKKS